jgi:hypothetical protein
MYDIIICTLMYDGVRLKPSNISVIIVTERYRQGVTSDECMESALSMDFFCLLKQ